MDKQHVLITVNGTGVPDPFGPGFSGDLGWALVDPMREALAQFWGPEFASPYRWAPVGYPAAVAPMGPSVQAGVTEVLRILDLPENNTTFALSGYSQGALVTDIVWRDHLLTGSHKHRKDDCIAIINFGDPMRAPGVSNGNVWAGIPVPGQLNGHTTGGIAGPGCLTAAQTPDFLLSCNLPGDLYGSAPIGDDPWTKQTQVGHDETIIFDLIMKFSFKSVFALAEEAVEIVTMPLVNLIPLVQAIVNGLTFAVAGPSAPHWQYGPFIAPMVTYLLYRGYSITPR